MRLALVALLAACKVTGAYTCEQDDQCVRGAVTGRCEATHVCSLQDGSCASGYRYDNSAGSLAQKCVDAPVDAGVDATDAPPDAPAAFARVNLGGTTYMGVDYPGTWTGDPTGATTCSNGSHYSSTGDVNGTVDDPLFLTNVATVNATMNCALTGLPDGNYRVRTLFANTFCGCPGGVSCTMRFDVGINGTMVGTVDVTSEGGCALAPDTGKVVDHHWDVAVIGGQLALSFTPNGGAVTQLNALEVTPLP
jgi:hypothetical protein